MVCHIVNILFAYFVGPLSDVIQLLLTTLFKMQEEEDDEILETDCNTGAFEFFINYV